MNRRYLFNNQDSTQQNASPWWHPLTQWWGIFGVIIFVGLVMRLMDNGSHWFASPPTPFSSDAATPAQSNPISQASRNSP
jgi:hypothetical protein